MTSDKCMHHIITTTVKTYISITPKQFPCTPLQSIFTTPSPRGPLFCLLSLKINYTFLELHINGIIEHLLFCVLFFFFWNRISQITEQLLQRSMVFSTVLYLVRTKNIKQVRDTFLQSFKKKQISTYTVSLYGPGTWEGSLIIEGVLALVSQKGGI